MKSVVAASVLALFFVVACRDKGTDGATDGAAGASASSGKKDEFCKLVEAQYAAMTKAQASGTFADPAKTKAYFIEQKAMNEKILSAAPPEVRADVELQTKNGNAAYDAQIAGNREQSKAASAVLQSKENVDASSRIRAFCGIKAPAPG
jgi:hypothetical protein